MAVFSTYNTLIERYLADTTETFFDNDMKVDAVNETLQELLEDYDVPELMVRATITFDSDGLSDIPTTYFRMIKLWAASDSGIEENEYRYLIEDKFDAFDPTSAHYWTEDYVIADAKRMLKALPTNSGTLQIRYVKLHTEVDEDDLNDSGLQDRWNKAIAFGASYKLLINAGQYDEARFFENEYNKRKARVYAALKDRGGFKGNSRIKSRWERESLLNRS